jgi:hypothetical protein
VLRLMCIDLMTPQDVARKADFPCE